MRFLKKSNHAGSINSLVINSFSVPYALYKVRLWLKAENERKRIGALLCRTKEGGKEKVQYTFDVKYI